MSFGTDPGPEPSQAVRDAVDYAFAHNVVMAAAAADSADRRAGLPGQPPAADRHRAPTSRVGKGLSVTAADASDARASFAGQGSQISLAAYGAYDASPARPGRPGSSAPSPPGPTSSRPARSGCRRARRAAAAPPSPATPATPTCRAPRWRPRWSRPPARWSATSTPTSPSAEIVRLIKETARRPAGVVDRRPGLGHPRRRRRADPRGEHRPPRAVLAGQAARRAHGQAHDHRALERRPTRRRRACARRASRASSSGARPTAGRSSACSRPPARRARSPCAAAAATASTASPSTTPATASPRPSRPTRGSRAGR